PLGGDGGDAFASDRRGRAAGVAVHDHDAVGREPSRLGGLQEPTRRGRADVGAAHDHEGGDAKAFGYRDSSFFLTRAENLSNEPRPVAVSVAAHSALWKAMGVQSWPSRSRNAAVFA